MSLHWVDFLGTTAASSALIMLVAFLGRTWITERLTGAIQLEYEIKLESHKAVVKERTEAALEYMRSTIRQASFEHEILFSQLQQRRVVVIEELYELLVQMVWDMADHASVFEWANDPPKSEKFGKAMDSAALFFRYFEKKRLFLPQAICDRLDDFVRQIRQKNIDFGIFHREPDPALNTQRDDKRHDAWVSAHDYMTQEVPHARKALEDELRRILGDNSLDKDSKRNGESASQ